MSVNLNLPVTIKTIVMTGTRVTEINGRYCDISISDLPQEIIDELLDRELIIREPQIPYNGILN